MLLSVRVVLMRSRYERGGPVLRSDSVAGDQTNPVPDDVLIALADGPGTRSERLERALRDGVRTGRLTAGTVLPPSRTLAASLGVSRWLVTEVYGQLVAEGLLEARTGSGTVVAARSAPPSSAPVGGAEEPLPAAPRRATYDLAPGVPDLRHVPRDAWLRAARAALAVAPPIHLFLRPPGGLPDVRRAIAEHLRRSRAVDTPDAGVVVTGGATDGMHRVVTALVRAGHRALLVEDPSWAPLRDAAAAHGLEVVPVPVDAEGIGVAALAAAAERTGARCVLVTPAHQFPTGVALAPALRERLLGWAREVDGLVVEDDYDAEFRYDRRPVAALQGADPTRVLLLGSASKTLAPAFGVGWAVVPERWRAVVLDAPGIGGGASAVDQLAFAAMVTDGAYARHLRASRGRYHRRRDAVVAELAAALPEAAVSGIAAGMHLVLDLAAVLPQGADAADVVREAAARDVTVVALRRYQVERSSRSARLVVGYGNLADARVAEAVRRLAEAVRATAGQQPRAPRASRAGTPGVP